MAVDFETMGLVPKYRVDQVLSALSSFELQGHEARLSGTDSSAPSPEP
jgi:hypothetical protein